MYFPNKTAAYFYKISFIVFFLGSPNFWIEHLNVPKTFYKVYRFFSKCINGILPFFIVFEIGSFVTQTNLSTKQVSDLLIFGISHPLLYSYSLKIWNNQEDLKQLFSYILRLKSIYNDEQVEKMMLKKSMWDSTALALSCILAVLSHTINAFWQYIKSEGTFTTLITAWPLVDDPSHIAHIARVIYNLIWWIFVSRIIASYIIVIGLVTSVTFQYINLQSYFCNLTHIFEDNNLNQREKEIKYEESFKIGIKLHSNTIEYFGQFLKIFKDIFSSQTVFVILMLVFLILQMLKSERTMANTAATVFTTTAVLISTGFFLWNAGDITVEASKLASAMYFSGWYNCREKSSTRVRKLVVIAMTHAQRPVVIKGLDIIDLSYQSYLSLVKSSYSVFSVIY